MSPEYAGSATRLTAPKEEALRPRVVAKVASLLFFIMVIVSQFIGWIPMVDMAGSYS